MENLKAALVEIKRLLLYKKLFDTATEIMVIANMGGYFTDVNIAFIKETGFPKEVLTGKPFISFIHPEDVGNTNKAFEGLKVGIDVRGFRNRYETFTGEYKLIEWDSSTDGEYIYAIAKVINQ